MGEARRSVARAGAAIVPWQAALLAIALLAACGPAPTKDDQRARRIEQSFVGRFTGTVERRSDDGAGRVYLPATMIGKRAEGGGVDLVVELVKPGAAEREVTRLRVLGASRELELSSEDGARIERFRIERFAAFTGLGELIVNGSTEEAGQPAEVRILYSVDSGGITWTRDARPPGGEFKFRQRYTMKRAR